MNKILNFLGLCMKAGKIISGEQGVESAIKNNKAKFVIIASDASNNTIKKFKNSSSYYNIDFFIGFSKEEISLAIGKYNIAVIAILDENFSKKIKEFCNDLVI